MQRRITLDEHQKKVADMALVNLLNAKSNLLDARDAVTTAESVVAQSKSNLEAVRATIVMTMGYAQGVFDADQTRFTVEVPDGPDSEAHPIPPPQMPVKGLEGEKE